MQTLVLVGHPNLEASRVNKKWAQAFSEQSNVTVRDLSSLYPEWDIDVITEQKLLLESSRIIFQFPLYWYSCPPILKHYIDLVFLPGFAYASGYRLKDKEFMVLTSVGSAPEDYRSGGHNNFTVDELLRSFEQTVKYCKGKYLSPYYIYRSLAIDNDEIDATVDPMLSYALKSIYDPEAGHKKFIADTMQKIYERAMETD
ncbi:MAG: NAD(P)H-dependent oxidoreductase [Rhizobiales bacterium]|nr:NAD(P)H-dependent oxidoreductase [Hyphomicrobiales bacterium]